MSTGVVVLASSLAMSWERKVERDTRCLLPSCASSAVERAYLAADSAAVAESRLLLAVDCARSVASRFVVSCCSAAISIAKTSGLKEILRVSSSHFELPMPSASTLNPGTIAVTAMRG